MEFCDKIEHENCGHKKLAQEKADLSLRNFIEFSSLLSP